MIPLRDRNPSGSPPLVTILLIIANSLVFFFELSLGDRLEPFLFHYGLIPARMHVDSVNPVTRVYLPFLTSMFFHGGWLHLIGNMWYLWIFGDNVEDRLGHGRFLIFYLLCGVVAAVVHVLFNPFSTIPVVGASGAIAGVLGAYLISFPHARIVTLVPIFFFIQLIELPAVIVLLFWFVIQFFNGAMSVAMTANTGGVAWWAHVGGFVCGMFLVRPFSRRRTVYRRRF